MTIQISGCVWEGEAPAEPLIRYTHRLNGSAAASPSRPGAEQFSQKMQNRAIRDCNLKVFPPSAGPLASKLRRSPSLKSDERCATDRCKLASLPCRSWQRF